jgi:hypothetical protein
MLDRRVYKSQEQWSEASRKLEFIGRPKEQWQSPSMFSLYPTRREPDFWGVELASGAFAVDPKALDTVYMFLEMAGQMLPLEYNGKTLTVCNITCCIDCIDHERSEWRTLPSTGERYAVRKPFFVPEHLTSSTLFKIPQMPRDIFCWEEHKEAESEFKASVEKEQLKGLKFELEWTNE